jgi:large subunit ribosomal protein L3
MGQPHSSRAGSLQFWPRKRAENILPSANWNAVKNSKGKINGFIGYKVGMASVYAKDNTPDSMTKGKRIIVPITIVECPEMKIYSVRFYKNNKVAKDIIVNFDDEMKRKLKKPKQIKTDEIEKININDYDDVRVIVYSLVKKIGIQKVPEMLEMALNGNKEDKMKYIKEKLNKEISITDAVSEGLVDIHGVTKGYGLQGPVRRFGITLKFHKSEKGVRRPGTLGPWHPARVSFRVPMAGQTGFQTRVVYNSLILQAKNIKENDINRNHGFHKYGKIKTSYLLLKGSLQGPEKRPLLIVPAIRPTPKKAKQKFEVIEIR